ncbi:hypothetical protein [Pediococcus acidilactici]|nr:hypothetical protein [Pediococcus acidilactici]MDB8860130.1 hypothetical protein [Pediococcus acidilactici]MDB8863832.1 hypothetical protein [Pediococcus acidilactici]MDB8866018.1 hypothetical protein [Pediococcus acidilactici]
MKYADRINHYFIKNNLKAIDVKQSSHGFVYIVTNDEHPMYRYSELNRGLLLQHDLGNNEWRDIWLGEREKQLALF